MKNKLFSALLLLFMLMGIEKTYALEPEFYAKSAIVIDAEDGSVLYNYNESEVLGIASITKLMTIFIALEEIEIKKIPLTEITYISEKAQSLMLQGEDISGVYFTEGQSVTIDELIHLGLIFSDNGAMVQLAEVISGSEENHVKLMNKKAEEWGLDNTNFVNVTGLTMSDYGEFAMENTMPEDYNVSTAFELSKMVFNIIKEQPEILEITSQAEYEFNGETVSNWNLMLPTKEIEYPGVVGLKTGSSVEAGYCFTSYYEKNESENYITVVLGSEDTYSRFTDTSSLLDWVNSEEFIKVMDTNEEIPINVNGNSEVLHPLYSITTSDEFFLNGFIKDVTYNEIFFDEDGDLKKTVPVGEIVATMNIQKIDSTSASNIFSEGEILSIPLVSENEIKKEKLVVKKAKDIKMFFEEYLNK